MMYSIKRVTIDDYDAIYELWNSTEQSKRALNPVDDSCEGIARYLKRNPDTCFAAVKNDRIIGVILTGHDGRRAIIHQRDIWYLSRRKLSEKRAFKRYSDWSSKIMNLPMRSGSSRGILSEPILIIAIKAFMTRSLQGNDHLPGRQSPRQK